MEELIKVARNGQWILEKAKKNTPSQDEAIRAWAEARQRVEAGKAAAAAAPRTPPKDPMAGMRVADRSTQYTSGGENPKYTKEQVAEIRSRIPEIPYELEHPKTEKPKLSDKEKHVIRTQKRMEAQQQADDEKAQARMGNKGAWKDTTKFLGEKGGEKGGSVEKDVLGVKGYGAGKATGEENKGWKGLAAAQETRDMLDQAHRTGKLDKPKPQLQPPMEMFRDEKGNAQMRVRQGRMHNEGATTRGKIVMVPSPFPTGEKNEAGEPIFARRMIPQQQEHIWSWDHNKKQWNHVRTNHVSVNK